MDWMPMKSAPRDGTSFQAKIPGHGSDNVIAWGGGAADGTSLTLKSRQTTGRMASAGKSTRAASHPRNQRHGNLALIPLPSPLQMKENE